MERAKAVASGVLKFGNVEIECHVLEDGRRLISQRGIIAGIGAGTKSGDLARHISKLPDEFSPLALVKIVEFTKQDNPAIVIGRDAAFFVDLCGAFTKAWVDGKIHPKQEHIARTCIAVVSSLAKVGIDALIDEATGYQAVRQDDYLQRLFEHTFREEASKWQLTFPPSLARALAPLWGVSYVGGSHPIELRNAYGQLYEFILGKERAVELRRRASGSGSKNHQFLQEAPRSLLSNDLRIIEILASQSGSKREFWDRMRNHFRGESIQLALVS